MRLSRNIKAGAFCWQEKAALRKIREAFDAQNAVASALGVYFALTEIASDTGSEEFQTTNAWISRMSGLSARTVRTRLRELKEIGLVEIDQNDPRIACTYRLPGEGGNGCRPGGNDPFQASLPPLEENKNKDRRKGEGPDTTATPNVKKPMSLAQQIALKDRCRILEKRIAKLDPEATDQAEREERDKLKSQLTKLENLLLEA